MNEEGLPARNQTQTLRSRSLQTGEPSKNVGNKMQSGGYRKFKRGRLLGKILSF